VHAPTFAVRVTAVLLLAFGAVGCGDAVSGAGASDAGGASGEGEVALDVVVYFDASPDVDAPVEELTLTCDAEGATLAFAGPVERPPPPDAEGACVAVRAAVGELAGGPDPDQMCTQQYGGPQEATFVGTIDGAPIDRRITRSDGCGIALWDRLQPLLGEPV
jgi:hypothetical protein